ncbi:MAG: response regulator, partial [Thermodesulfobacteriota bacterium]
VEDEKQVLDLAERILTTAGYPVLSASTPAAAIELARKKRDRIRLLISDMVMPEMGGRQLKEKIEAVCPDIRTLFISGYPENQRIEEETDAAFLQKPFNLKSLTEKVRQALDR